MTFLQQMQALLQHIQTIAELAVPALLIGAALGLAALIYPVVELSGDEDLRRVRERERTNRAEAAGQEAAAALARYLEQLRAELDLPVGLVDDAVQEIADHVEDTRQALVEEGLESGAAVREALARLGRPKELARNLTAAGKSTRRMLAGAAGGVFTIPGGFVLGGLTGLLAYVPAVMVLTVAMVGLRMYDPLAKAAVEPIPGLIFLAFGLFVAARTGVRVSAALSHRKPSSIGWIWALLGTSLIEAWMILGYRTRQSWPLVALEVLVPLAFAAGAVVSINGSHVRLFRKDDRWDLVAAIICFGAVAGLVAGLSTTLLPDRETDVPDTGYRRLVNLDAAGPLADREALPGSKQVDALGGSPIGVMGEGGLPLDCRQPQGDVWECELRGSAWGMNEKTMAGINADTTWQDFRIEVWQGITGHDPYGSAYGNGGIVQGVSAPTIVVPAVRTHVDMRDSMLVTGGVSIPLRRDGPSWWIVVTAEGPDGNRYRLTNGTGIQCTFDGSAWEWLTAEG